MYCTFGDKNEKIAIDDGQIEVVYNDLIQRKKQVLKNNPQLTIDKFELRRINDILSAMKKDMIDRGINFTENDDGTIKVFVKTIEELRQGR